MTSAERRIKIFDKLQENGSVQVNELAVFFGVTTMTIRRDLAVFEKQGLITTNYGGAIMNKGTVIEPSFSLKSSQMVQAKQLIGRKAAGLLQNGDSVFIDCGTSALSAARFLNNQKLTVVTNSLAVCNVVKNFSKIRLICIMGIYQENSDGFLGSLAIESISKFNVDKAIIATQGFDFERGATVPDEEDAKVKESIVRSARQRILLADHEKIGARFFAKFADVDEIDYLITDQPVDSEFEAMLQGRRLQILVAED